MSLRFLGGHHQWWSLTVFIVFAVLFAWILVLLVSTWRQDRRGRRGGGYVAR